MAVNIEKAAIELVEVFHKHKIPIALMQSVFERAVEKTEEKTIPYSPRRDSMADLAISEMTSSVTEPSG